MTMRRMRFALIVATALVALSGLAACGKRQGELELPNDAVKQYPRQYPAW